MTNSNKYQPNWWTQAIAIEYLSCRDFSKGDRIGQINFNLLSPEQLANAVQEHKIVSFGTIVHNVNEETFRSRTLIDLISNIAKPIVNADPRAIIPQGIVSKHHFPWLGNSIDVIDPIESFGSHIQVLDDNILYQWEVAKFEGVEGRNYGRWVSDYVDLTEFDKTYDEFQALMQLKHKVGGGHEQYIKQAEGYISKLRKMRSDAFLTLLSVHENLKNRHKGSISKVVQYAPPLLSHFESMKVENGEISTIASMAPVFYRAALKHCYEAENISDSNPASGFVLDKIYEERAQAVIAAAACLETVMNEVGSLKHEDVWYSMEKLSVLEKWMMLGKLSTTNLKLDFSRDPFQTVSKIIGARNDLIHFKPAFRKVTVIKDKGVSKLGLTLNSDMISKLPQILVETITEVHKLTDLVPPPWLSDQPGWTVSNKTQV